MNELDDKDVAALGSEEAMTQVYTEYGLLERLEMLCEAAEELAQGKSTEISAHDALIYAREVLKARPSESWHAMLAEQGEAIMSRWADLQPKLDELAAKNPPSVAP